MVGRKPTTACMHAQPAFGYGHHCGVLHNGVEKRGRYEAEIVSTHRHNLGRLVTEGNLILEATHYLGQERVLNSKSD